MRILADGGYRLRDSRGVDEVQAATFDRRNLTEDGSLRVGTEVLPGESNRLAVDLTGSLYRDQYSQDQRGSDALDQYEDSRELGSQLDLQFDQVVGRHVISVGGEGLYQSLSSPRLTQDGERWRGALFAQDELRLGLRDQWAIVPACGSTPTRGSAPIPRRAWRPAGTRPKTWLSGSTPAGASGPPPSRDVPALREPTAGYLVQGNPDLQPETSIGVDGGHGGGHRRPPAAAAGRLLQRPRQPDHHRVRGRGHLHHAGGLLLHQRRRSPDDRRRSQREACAWTACCRRTSATPTPTPTTASPSAPWTPGPAPRHLRPHRPVAGAAARGHLPGRSRRPHHLLHRRRR